MDKKELTKRYLIFFVGLSLTAFGVAFITKALLGTSPISAIPYTLSLIIPRLTLGNWTIVFSLLLILFQIMLLGKSVNKFELILQAVISFAFGYFIDFSMYCLKLFNPDIYIIQIISLLIGCTIIATGAYLQVIADVVMLPGDAFVRAITRVIKREYGEIRVISDVTMAVIAGILCLVFLHELVGVREGTIIAAIITGFMVKYFLYKSKPLTQILLLEPIASENTTQSIPTNNFVLTISREYGSGGRLIGKLVAKALNIGYYDSELIRLAAQESEYSENTIADNEQKIDNPFLHDLYMWYNPTIREEELPIIERIFHIESHVINELAAKESCVIVGRLANHILKDHNNTFNVFICADTPSKVKRIAETENLSLEDAEKKIHNIDKQRANHCHHFTSSQWGKPCNYDLTINSGHYSIEKCADIITNAIQLHK